VRQRGQLGGRDHPWRGGGDLDVGGGGGAGDGDGGAGEEAPSDSCLYLLGALASFGGCPVVDAGGDERFGGGGVRDVLGVRPDAELDDEQDQRHEQRHGHGHLGGPRSRIRTAWGPG
jgi:hypothetical protein